MAGVGVDDGDGDDEDVGFGRGRGREILEIPMCANCVVECENDEEDKLVEKALTRIDLADGGMSRSRWNARKTGGGAAAPTR